MTDKPDIVERPHRGSEKILDELNALRAQFTEARDALEWIAKFGRDNPGYGYSCATKALAVLAKLGEG